MRSQGEKKGNKKFSFSTREKVFFLEYETFKNIQRKASVY